ncbi:hypothetical protein [Streptomyces sp. NPDC003090]|uniref:restriction endonuclease subunit S n=1 Tax=Streptomyces sp. NPDC003090 TaxID=3154274 RepID=UPI0037F38E2A
MRGEESAAAEPGFRLIELDALLDRIETGWSPACDAEPPRSDEWGVIRVSAVTSGRFDPQESKRLPAGLPPRPGLEIKAGDLLLARANGARSLVGAVCYVNQTRSKLMLSDKTMRLVPNEKVADAAFLALVLASPAVRRQIGVLLNGSSGQNNISQEDIRHLLVPEIPLDLQRRIVAAHEAIEARVTVLERVAAKRTAVVEAAVGSFWQDHVVTMSSLESMCSSLDAGITLSPHRTPRSNPVGYLRVANVRKGAMDISDISVLEGEDRDRPRYELRTGDVLVVEGHADPEQIGRAAVVAAREEGLLYQNHLFRLRFSEIIPEFAMLWLNSERVRTYWRTHCATSSGLYTINRKLLKGVPFPVVNMIEQEKLVGAWRSSKDAVASVNQRIAKLRILQQGLVKDLLTGG